MNPNSKEFKDLQAKWYAKLKKSGFVDAEDDRDRLIEHHTHKYYLKDPLAFASQERYYQLAAQVLHTYSFRNSQERAIWKAHCEGLSRATSAKKLGVTEYTVESLVNEVAKLIKVT